MKTTIEEIASKAAYKIIPFDLSDSDSIELVKYASEVIKEAINEYSQPLEKSCQEWANSYAELNKTYLELKNKTNEPSNPIIFYP